MAKRIADKELTDRNWDQEEEGEEVSVGNPDLHPQSGPQPDPIDLGLDWTPVCGDVVTSRWSGQDRRFLMINDQ